MAAAARSAWSRGGSLPALLLLVVTAAALPACQSAYARSRTLDLLDTVPVSVGWGWGISASVEATPCFRFGLGLSPVVSWRAGYEDRRLWGQWHEYEAAFPWTIWLTDVSKVPERPEGANEGRLFGDGLPLMYRWQLDRDAPLGEGEHRGRWEPQLRQWGRHAPYGRETGGGFVIPAYRRKLTWEDLHLQQGDNEGLHAIAAPDRATLWLVTRNGPDEPRAWDLFEADLFLGILGLRVGLRPVEGVDFLLGFIGLDFVGDDVSTPRSNLPAEVRGGLTAR
jgi:hypothetical protein